MTGRPVYVDARCLQDPDYATRGIGTHLGALLGQFANSALRGGRLIALLSPELPALSGPLAALFDECTASLLPVRRGVRGVYIAGSPMTHEPGEALCFRPSEELLCAAAVYDFIPFDAPGYLNGFGARAVYLAQMAALKRCDLFFPISAHTAGRLRELLGIGPERMVVTGASMRASFVRASRGAAGVARGPYYFLLGGEDERKNAWVAVEGVRLLREAGVAAELVIAGQYSEESRERLLGEGRSEWLRVAPGYLDEGALAELYRGAEAVIVPSRWEGFSLPVVEAAECGSIAVGSRIGVHLELIEDEAALFECGDASELARKLAALRRDVALRERVRASQAKLAGRFHPERVGERFWSRIAEELEAGPERCAAVLRGRRPSVAFVTPYPPQQTGVADFTKRTLDALGGVMECQLYTDAERPLALAPHVQDRGRSGVAALLTGRHDRIVQVLGNSHFHQRMLATAERFGGAVILHDARHIHVCYELWGARRFGAYVSERLGRVVPREEIERWLADAAEVPAPLFDPVLGRTAPVFVHTPGLRDRLRELYGVAPVLLGFPPNTAFAREEVTARSRSEARAALGLAQDAVVVASFGIVASNKLPEVCIGAVQLLRERGGAAELYFAGNVGGHRPACTAMVERLGLDGRVHFLDGYLPAAEYRQFLLAADAAIQLRSYAGGQASAAYADCLSAGLPVVVTDTLAADCGVTAYARPVPLAAGAEGVAAGLEWALASRYGRERDTEARDAYLEEHSFERYGLALRDGLGLG